MNAKQTLFVQEYLVDLNATQAYIRAGYSAKTANVCAAQLLTKPSIRAAVDAAMKQRSDRVGITADRVLEELAILGFSSVWHYIINDAGNVELAEGAPDSAIRSVSSIKRKRRTIPRKDEESIVEVETEIRLWDKPATLRLAGQHLGLYKDKVEHSGEGGTAIQVNVTHEVVDPSAEP